MVELIKLGTRVLTVHPEVPTTGWSIAAQERRKWGVTGTVGKHSDSHGLCYEVQHDDGSSGWYEPSELQVLETSQVLEAPVTDSEEDPVRLNFLVRQSVKDRLDRLKEKTEAASLTEVVRRALLVYEFLLNREKGAEIIIRNREGSEKIVVLAESGDF